MKLLEENVILHKKYAMSWDYRLSKGALKHLKRFPKYDREQIFRTLEDMKENMFGGDMKPIQGEEGLYRRRIGNYRIYFRPLEEIHILDVPEIIRKQSH